jgi:hypothetical protein
MHIIDVSLPLFSVPRKTHSVPSVTATFVLTLYPTSFRDCFCSSQVTKFETGAPDGYHYKGNIEHGPLINIKVDQNSKIVDWRKVEVHAFQSSMQDEASISDSEEREEVENLKRQVQDKVDKKKNTV